MAVFILKRGLLDEKNFSIGGKRRKDKRKAYELRQQRLNNGAAGQQKNQANQTTSKLPGQSQPKKQTGNRQQGVVGQQNQTDPNSQQNKKAGNTTAIVPVNKNNQPINQGESLDNSSSNVPAVNNDQSSGTNLLVGVNNQNSENNSGTTAIVPVNNQQKEQPKNIPDRPVGPFPTGQQGTTGNVDWMALGKAAWKKAKPIRVGAAVLGGAALGASLLAANKIGKTVDQAMDDRVDDRLEENRRLRRLKQERRIYERQLR